MGKSRLYQIYTLALSEQRMVAEMRIHIGVGILIGAMLCCSGCKKAGPIEPIAPPEPLPNDLALFASIDGNWTGIQVFNANSLQLIDSFQTSGGVPFHIDLSADYQTWYSVWAPAVYDYTLFAIDARSKNILNQRRPTGISLTSAMTKGFLITYGARRQFWNHVDFSLVHEDSTDRIDLRMVVSPDERKLYSIYKRLGAPAGRSLDGIMVYQLDQFQVERTFSIADSLRQRKMQEADLKISPDGRYLFITVFNWGQRWYGSFHAIDLTTDQVVAEYPCGKFSQMAVSPNGRYVYITDPAGYLYEMQPTGHLLRYDILARTMEVFIDWIPYNLTGGGRLITDQVVIAPDNRTMFLTTFNDGQTSDGKTIGIMKVDLRTKSILGIYEMPKDHRGYVTQIITRLKLGTYRN